MKALKINTEVNLKNGMQIPSGAIVLIGQTFANPSVRQTVEGSMKIPCNISSIVYASLSAYQNLSQPIDPISILDFDPNMKWLYLSVESYETLACEPLLIGAVKSFLETIYPDKIQEITI